MKQKKKKAKNMALRNRILSYVNAFIGLIIIVSSFVALAFSSGEAIDFTLGMAFFICPIFLAMLTEINTFLFRLDKKTAIESLIPAGVYLTCILILIFFVGDNGIVLGSIITLSIYLSIRTAKLCLTEWRSDKKKKTKIILSVLFGIFITVCYLIPVILFKNHYSLISFYAFVFLVEGLAMITVSITHGTDINMLPKVLYKTHTLEIIIGLVIVMITASTIFPFVEPGILTFGDGLWYSFAIVTTIGFGDFYAVSFIGRVLSVFLGIYGIVVVALITSVIVNLYNEKKKYNLKDEQKEEFKKWLEEKKAEEQEEPQPEEEKKEESQQEESK